MSEMIELYLAVIKGMLIGLAGGATVFGIPVALYYATSRVVTLVRNRGGEQDAAN